MTLTKDVLMPQEVAEYLQLAPETVYRYMRQYYPRHDDYRQLPPARSQRR